MKRIIIFGAGIIGCTLAYTLSKYDLDVTVIEKSSYVGSGATKSNSAMLHEGLSTDPHSLRGKLVIGAKKRICELCERLGVPYRENVGLITLAFNEAEFEVLRTNEMDAKRLGVSGKILSRDETLHLEPHINKEIVGSFYSATVGTVSPYELAIALAEVAFANGVKFLFQSYPIELFDAENYAVCVLNNGQSLQADLVINAAGIYADEVASLAGDDSFSLSPRRGEYVLYDKSVGEMISHIISVPGNKLSKGMILVPLDHGNLLAGSSAENIDDKSDLDTTNTVLEKIYTEATARICPEIPQKRHIITNFSGNRAISNTNDYVIGFSQINPHLFNFAGIQSPGLTSCLNIVDYGMAIISNRKKDLIGRPKKYWNEVSSTNENSRSEKSRAANNGRIVCRCEQILDVDIIRAINADLPCLSLDALKRKLRVGMGKCQGGHCSNRVAYILSQETNQPMEAILKDLPGSNFIP